MLFDSEETKAWKAYEKKTAGMGVRMSKSQFLRMHYPKKKVSEDTEERYTTARTKDVESGLKSAGIDDKQIRRLRGQN